VSDDVGTEQEHERRDTAAVRDDIMKRLLEYQRKQRAESEALSSVWATPPVRAPEAYAEPAPPEPEPRAEEPAPVAVQDPPPPMHEVPAEDVAPVPVGPSPQERVESLQATLEGVRSQIANLRQTFQDMAIAADERLAEIEEQISRIRQSGEPS
jgi:hypothetical protein